MFIDQNILLYVSEEDIQNGEFKIPKRVETIEPRSFCNLKSLTRITIPSQVSKIGFAAFRDCDNLSKVWIKNGLSEIGCQAFNNCKMLESIELPKSVTKIKSCAFLHCESLTRIKLPKKLKAIESGVFFACKNLSSIEIPNGVTEIDHEAFGRCESLKTINIPSSLKKLRRRAFYGCKMLESIVIPKGVTEIELETFSNCVSLKSINIPSSLKKLGRRAFCGCKMLESIIIPKGLTEIDSEAFRECENLTDIVIPEGVTKINNETFAFCTKLSNVVIPKSVKTIESNAFWNCSSLTNIVIPDGVTEIGDGAFCGCSNLSSLSLPKSVTKIGSGAFRECAKLTNIVIPEGVTEIGSEAFCDCKSLTKVVIPDSMKEFDTSMLKKHKFKYSYRIKGQSGTIFSNELPKDEEVEDLIDFDKISSVFKGFAFNFKYSKDMVDDLNMFANEMAATKCCLPWTFVRQWVNGKKLKTLMKDYDFRFLKSQAGVDLTKQEKYDDLPNSEIRSYYNFMAAIGCFSKEKLLDKKGKETLIPLAQKATSIFSLILKSKALKIGDFHELFYELSIDAKPNQNFLKFISEAGKNNNFFNIELLLDLEKDFQGIFMKAMTDFDGAKKFRTGLNQQGMPMIIPWAKAFKKLYANTYFLGVTEDTRDIAEIYTERGLEQSDFDKGVELRIDATEKQVCEHILGHPLRESTIESIEQIKNDTEMLLKESKSLIDESYKKEFTYEMLSKYDPRNAIMGLYTSCCATITSGFYGRSIAEASVLSDDVQNLVVLDGNGEIIGKGTLYVNKEKGYAVFNDFEIHKNYRKHETDAGIYDTNTESQIQCENERELIFCALMRGVRDFVKDWDLQHPDKPIQQVNVGMGYNRLKAQCQRFKKATQNLSVPIEYEFRDAQDEQYVLYDRKSEIKKGGLQL